MTAVRFRSRPDAPAGVPTGPLTAVELADWFLNLHAVWFLPGPIRNTLVGQRPACRAALVGYLIAGESPPPSVDEGYVVGKFAGEAEDWFERV